MKNRKAYYSTAKWRKKRELKLRMAGYTCERCGVKGNEGTEMHVHHLRYDNFGGDELMSELEALCVHCHRDEHRLKENKKRDKLIGLDRRYGR